MKKIVVVIFASLFLVGCSDPIAPPEGAVEILVKECFNKGGFPRYYSNQSFVDLSCKKNPL